MNPSAFFGVILLVGPFLLPTSANGTSVIKPKIKLQETRRDKVVVSLYYEYLCSGCTYFAYSSLCPLYNSPLGDYITVEFVPYGNAQTVVSNSTGEIQIICQHGVEECAGNKIESCALKMLSYDLSTRYICCVENFYSETMPQKCAEELKLDYKALKDCADGAEGEKLLYLNGLKTYKLRPEQNYVPWVLVNGKHSVRAENDLLHEVCSLIQDPKPADCNSVEY